MTTPLLADQPAGTDPSQPSLRGRPKRERSKSIFLIVGVVVGVLVSGAILLLLIGGLFLRSSVVSESSAPLPNRVTLEQVEGAPDADLVLPVERRRLTGVDDIFSGAGGSPMSDDAVIVTGSPELLAIVNSEVGGSEIYRWTEVAANTSPSTATIHCIGVFGHVGQAECSSEAPTDISLSSGETNGKGETLRYVAAFHLPKDAAWIIVESNDGYQVAAQVVDGAGYLQWVAASVDATKPSAVSALDANLDEVWSAPAP